jgi:hypothetical protein
MRRVNASAARGTLGAVAELVSVAVGVGALGVLDGAALVPTVAVGGEVAVAPGWLSSPTLSAPRVAGDEPPPPQAAVSPESAPPDTSNWSNLRRVITNTFPDPAPRHARLI